MRWEYDNGKLTTIDVTLIVTRIEEDDKRYYLYIEKAGLEYMIGTIDKVTSEIIEPAKLSDREKELDNIFKEFS